MPRYFLHVPLIVGLLLLLLGCKDQDVHVGNDEEKPQHHDVIDKSTARSGASASDDASATTPQTTGSDGGNERADASRKLPVRSGPRKIQRPPAPSSQPATSEDTADARGKQTPPSTRSNASPTGSDNAPPSGPSQDARETSTVESDNANEEEHARHFAFDGSDEELEMILGMREIPPFRVDDLLTVEDLRLGLGRHTPTNIGQIQGQVPTPFYNNLWFQSNEADRLGLVLQYWYFQTPKAAQVHFEMHQKTAQAEPKPVGIASDAYYTEIDGTVTLVALSVENQSVSSLTCDIENCFVPQLMRWTTLIHERVAQ